MLGRRARVASVFAVARAAAAGVGGAAACDAEVTPGGADAGPADAGREVGAPITPADDAELDCEPTAGDDEPVPEPYAGRTSPFRVDADRIESGRARFVQSCARCHGSDAKGKDSAFGPPPADLTRALRSEDYLFWRISAGGRMAPFCSSMPAFDDLLSETARWALVAYIRSLAPSDAPDASGDADGGS